MKDLINEIKSQVDYMNVVSGDVFEDCNKVLNGANELIEDISWDLSILINIARDLKDLSFQLEDLHVGD